jgi:hypothetical protein
VVGPEVVVGDVAGVDVATGPRDGPGDEPGDVAGVADPGTPDADAPGVGPPVATGPLVADGATDGPGVSSVVAIGPGCEATGDGVGTTAMPSLGRARCCSSTPPMPNAITARTRFRTPRLRTSRAR